MSDTASKDDELRQKLHSSIRNGLQFNNPESWDKEHAERYDRMIDSVIKIIKQYGEVFVPVRGYEGAYEVSNYGNVRSIARINTFGGILKYGKNKQGYSVVSLSKDEKITTHNVHRIVALNFISNPRGVRTVNHKDGDKSNNHVQNLEWATQSENNIHAIQNGLRIKKQEENK